MSQIFQNTYPKNHFFEFLSQFCELNNNQYIFSKESFKRIKLQEKEVTFCENHFCNGAKKLQTLKAIIKSDLQNMRIVF